MSVDRRVPGGEETRSLNPTGPRLPERGLRGRSAAGSPIVRRTERGGDDGELREEGQQSMHLTSSTRGNRSSGQSSCNLADDDVEHAGAATGGASERPSKSAGILGLGNEEEDVRGHPSRLQVSRARTGSPRSPTRRVFVLRDERRNGQAEEIFFEVPLERLRTDRARSGKGLSDKITRSQRFRFALDDGYVFTVNVITMSTAKKNIAEFLDASRARGGTGPLANRRPRASPGEDQALALARRNGGPRDTCSSIPATETARGA